MPGRKGIPRPESVKDRIRAGQYKYQSEIKKMREFYLKHKDEVEENDC